MELFNMPEYDSIQILANFASTCRFCLAQTECVPILNEGSIVDDLLVASDFIITKVDEHDGLPNSICPKCLNCIIEFATLEHRCQQAYKILQDILNEQTEATTILEANDSVVEDTLNCDSDLATEEECLIDYLDEETTLDQEQHHKDNNSEHIEASYLEQPKLKTSSKSTRKGKHCPVCGKFVSQLSKHLPMHSGEKRHPCKHCPKRFVHDSTLRKHIQSVHLKIQKYRCAHCPETFTDRSSLRYHDVVKHKDARDFVCTVCDKAYHTSTGLQQHNQLTHEQRRFRCEECGKMFAMKYHLKAHEKTHSDVRPFTCEICDKAFKQIKNLKEHLAQHN